MRSLKRHSCFNIWQSILLPIKLIPLFFLLINSVYAVDFGIRATESSVTVQQNQFSTPLKLEVFRDDFDGPFEIDIEVKGGGRDVQAFIPDREKTQQGSEARREIDINIGTGRDVENGSYEVTVTATGTVNGQPRTRVATFTVNIERQGDTFEIAASPNKLTVSQGDVTQTQVTITESGNFDDPVYLEVGAPSLAGFSFDFSGDNAGAYAPANRSDILIGAQHWITSPDDNNQSKSTLTITTYPDTVPGEYTFHVYGRRDSQIILQRYAGAGRDTIPTPFNTSSTRRASFTVTVVADPVFIDLIEPVEFDITPEATLVVTPPSGFPHMIEIYVSAERSLETIKLDVKLEPEAEGISVGLDNRRVRQEIGPNNLLVAVTEEAQPGTYYAVITATSRGSNGKTNTRTTRVQIVVPDREDKQVSMGADPEPVSVNCVGSSCPEQPITGNCAGDACPDEVILNCSGGLCIENLELLCPDSTCASSLDLNCDTTSCGSNGVLFICSEGSCLASPGAGFIDDLSTTFPSLLDVGCSGQGCGDTSIIGNCYGDSCPPSVNLNCPGTGCTNTIELNCPGGFCSEDFTFVCSEGVCPGGLQFDCSGSSCDQFELPPGSRPFLTGASPSGGSELFTDGFESGDVSSWSGGNLSIGSNLPAGQTEPAVEPVVTPRGSSDAIPGSSSDLATIRAAANAIAANAGVCLDAECPIIDCATAGQLLQGLIHAEANLDEMYKWLIQASDDAMAHFQGLNAQGIITSEMMSQAQMAQALHKYLHDIGSIMLDLAALKEFYDNFKDGSFAEGSVLERLDGTYEMLKDLESATSTMGEAYDIDVPTVVSDVPGAAIGAAGGDAIPDATGSPNATPENLGSAVNDMKSQINDAIDIIKDAKDGKTPTAAVGKAIGRIVKTYSSGKMQERERLIQEYIANNTALYGDPNKPGEVSPVASSYAFLQKVNSRRFATEDALKAIRAAKNALMACMAKACDAVSLARPNVNTSFTGWGAALRHFNGIVPGLFSGLNGSFSVRDQCPGSETAISLFTGDGIRGGGSISLGGNVVPLNPARVPREAKCPRCQPYADRINTNLSENDYWLSEKRAIEEKLREAETLRQRLGVLEQRKSSNRRSINEMTQVLDDSEAFGFKWGPGLQLMLVQAEIRGRDLTRQIQEMEREIARLEADKNRLEGIDERLSDLRSKRMDLQRQLDICEAEYCKDYDEDNAAVGRLFGEIFGVEVIDVKPLSGNNPYNREDPLRDEDEGQQNSIGSNSSTPVATTNASFNAACDVNTGSGTNVLSVNGSSFCSVSGSAPQVSGGTANFSCVPGSTVTISGSCSATVCRAFLNTVTNLSCPVGPGFITGSFGGAGGYTGSASLNCTCQ